ncbi:MAG: hypothetical protein Q9168_006056 [Polycauliona sp. 1 TL-2023]
MSQYKENKSALRHDNKDPLLTKLDLSVLGKAAAQGAQWSKNRGGKVPSIETWTSNRAGYEMAADCDEPSDIHFSKLPSNVAAAKKPTGNKLASNGAESSNAQGSKMPSDNAGANKIVSSKMASNGAESSKTASKQNRPASTAPKTREQKIADALGPLPQPKGMIKDGKLTWTPPSQASSQRAMSQQSGVPLSRPSTECPAGSASQTSKFPCPYPDCNRGFLKETELRKHKMRDHDYCKLCDEDFEDDEAFHKHKIMSERHITCTVCSLDFRSESGRDRHYNLMHASSHNVKCRACDVTFAKGAALLQHFEKNECRPKDKAGISADHFEAQRAAMAMILQTSNLDRAGPTEIIGGSLNRLESVAFGGSVAGSSVYGGVPIEASEQPDFLTDHGRRTPSVASDNTERPLSPVESDTGTDLLSFPEDPRDALNASNLAALDNGRVRKGALADWPELGAHKHNVQGMSHLNLSDAGGAGQTPMSPGIPAPPSVQPSQSGYSVAGEMRGIELHQNPMSGEWECPYWKCHFKGALRQDLEAHFDDRNNGHRRFEHQCPSCLKRFKTASAMMAHLESPAVRCSMRNSKAYGNVLHLVSGGHLNVAGRHNDGSNRLVVPDDPAKTTESILRGW